MFCVSVNILSQKPVVFKCLSGLFPRFFRIRLDFFFFSSILFYLPERSFLDCPERVSCGEMVERFKASVLKTDEGQPSGGSNPPLSAIFTLKKRAFFLISFPVFKVFPLEGTKKDAPSPGRPAKRESGNHFLNLSQSSFLTKAVRERPSFVSALKA